jgi:cytochrome c oxidase subunit IV
MTIETASTDAHDGGQHASPPGTLHTDGGTHEGASDFTYVKIALALMLLTGAEIAVSYMDLGKAQVPLLLVMMFVKFFTVVLYFMHLRYDNVLFKRLFYSGLFLAIFVYVGALLTFHYFE